MKHTLISLATIVFLTTSPAFISKAADGSPRDKTEIAVKNAPRNIPFKGKIDGVDQQKKTITVGERVFQVTSETKIMKAGKPASLSEAKPGEDVGGSYFQTADSKLSLFSLRLGAKPNQPAKLAK